MHDGEVGIDSALVRRLVAAQFPRFADRAVRAVDSSGTVNAIYRLGDDLYVRLPRVSRWARDLEQELRWLPRLAAFLSLQIPQPVAAGRPANGYPFCWAIYRWIDGRPYTDETVDDERRAAEDLAQFVAELRRVDPAAGTPPRGGRRPLAELDAVTREAITSARNVIDSSAALAAWEHALAAPVWDGRPTWVHADLLRPNLLVRGGRLCGVLDFGSAGVGDPAADIIAAWSVFGPRGRSTFCRALEVDEGTRTRAMGFALHQAALIIPYYRQTNPTFAALAVRTVEEIVGERAVDRPPTGECWVVRRTSGRVRRRAAARPGHAWRRCCGPSRTP